MKPSSLILLLLSGLAIHGCAAARPTPTPAPLPTAFVTTPGPVATDVAARLRSRGLDARVTGERFAPRFGAHTGETVRVDGLAVGILAFADAASAERALTAATDPQTSQLGGDWLQKPHFVRSGDLLFTIVTDDEAQAARIAAALR
jgi:hypothetical protein